MFCTDERSYKLISSIKSTKQTNSIHFSRKRQSNQFYYYCVIPCHFEFKVIFSKSVFSVGNAFSSPKTNCFIFIEDRNILSIFYQIFILISASNLQHIKVHTAKKRFVPVCFWKFNFGLFMVGSIIHIVLIFISSVTYMQKTRFSIEICKKYTIKRWQSGSEKKNIIETSTQFKKKIKLEDEEVS